MTAPLYCPFWNMSICYLFLTFEFIINPLSTIFYPWGGGWSQSFSKPLNDWEMGSAKRFHSCLEGMRVYRDKKDRVLWTENKNVKYIVKSLYMPLEQGTSTSFPWSNIWKT